MNKDIIEGKWDQVKGKALQRWGALTDDALTVVEGDRNVLSGKIQEAYGISKDEADKQIKEWEDTLAA